MKDIYAQILARHAADVIKTTCALDSVDIMIEANPKELPLCEWSVRIDFQGSLASSGQEKLKGYVICGALLRDDALPLIAAISRYFGLDDSFLLLPNGPADLLSEFLNIIIGLTGAGWAEQGFEMEFSTPRNLGQLPDAPMGSSGQTFYIGLTANNNAKVEILVVFEDN